MLRSLPQYSVPVRSAYNHGQLNPMFGLHHGVYFLGIFGQYTAFSFGSARSCCSFQQYTSCICRLTKLFVGPKIFPPEPDKTAKFDSRKHAAGKACLANYIDDNFMLADSLRTGRKVLNVLRATTKFVGGKLSKSKELNNKKEGKVLGAIIVMGNKTGKKPAGMKLPSDKASSMLSSMKLLKASNNVEHIEFKALETLLGRCCWVSYLSTWALLYTLPLVALKWMPKAMRYDVFRVDHPLR